MDSETGGGEKGSHRRPKEQLLYMQSRPNGREENPKQGQKLSVDAIKSRNSIRGTPMARRSIKRV